MKFLFIVLILVRLGYTSVSVSDSCYQESQKYAGEPTKDGIKVTDRSKLNLMLSTLSPTYRSAAVKVCTNSARSSANYGELLGIQLAIADYASIKGTNPTSKELTWLPGLGTTVAATGVICETTVIDKTSGISSLITSADYTGVLTLSVQISGTQKESLNYGISSKFQITSRSFSFSNNNFLIGLYGSETSNIESLGVILYNSTICPKDGSKPVIDEAIIVTENTQTASTSTQEATPLQTSQNSGIQSSQTTVNSESQSSTINSGPDSCYHDSTQYVGEPTKDGFKVTDRTKINSMLTNLTSTYRSAAVKVCTNSARSSTNLGQLLGIQLAIADYASIKGANPTSQELTWLPGLGTTVAATGVTCETTVIDKTSGVVSLIASADYTGLITLSVQISGTQKESLNYGISSKFQITSRSFTFSKQNFLIGLYGSETSNIESLGVIINNSTMCPLNQSSETTINSPINSGVSQSTQSSSSTTQQTTGSASSQTNQQSSSQSTTNLPPSASTSSTSSEGFSTPQQDQSDAINNSAISTSSNNLTPDFCYQDSSKYVGESTNNGFKVTDRAKINSMLLNLTSTYRSAAVKVCINSARNSVNQGKLLGMQLAIADYAQIKGTNPSYQELTWLPGLGTTVTTTGVTCETTVIDKTSGISSLIASADYTGLITLSVQISGTQKESLNFGTSSKSQTSFQSFTFSKQNFLMGLYGSETSNIEQLGVIIYNSTICSENGPSPTIADLSITSVTSQPTQSSQSATQIVSGGTSSQTNSPSTNSGTTNQPSTSTTSTTTGSSATQSSQSVQKPTQSGSTQASSSSSSTTSPASTSTSPSNTASSTSQSSQSTLKPSQSGSSSTATSSSQPTQSSQNVPSGTSSTTSTQTKPTTSSATQSSTKTPTSSTSSQSSQVTNSTNSNSYLVQYTKPTNINKVSEDGNSDGGISIGVIVGLVLLVLFLLLVPAPVILAAIMLVATVVAALAAAPVAGFFAYKLITRSNANDKRKVVSDQQHAVETDEKEVKISEYGFSDLEQTNQPKSNFSTEVTLIQTVQNIN